MELIPLVFTIKWEYGRRMFDGCMPRKYQKKAMKNTKEFWHTSHSSAMLLCGKWYIFGRYAFCFFANIRRNRWRIRKRRRSGSFIYCMTNRILYCFINGVFCGIALSLFLVLFYVKCLCVSQGRSTHRGNGGVAPHFFPDMNFEFLRVIVVSYLWKMFSQEGLFLQCTVTKKQKFPPSAPTMGGLR